MTRIKIVLISVLGIVCLGFAATVPASTTYLVKSDGGGDFPNIAVAIEMAISGDVIELGDGVYKGSGNRQLDFSGKSLSIRSQSGDPSLCILDAEASSGHYRRLFTLRSSESMAACIEGVTLLNGFLPEIGEESNGGAIYCQGVLLTLENCVIENCHAWLGGAIYCKDSSPILRDCVIRNCEAVWYGGGIAIDGNSTVNITGGILEDNMAEYGAGIVCINSNLSMDACLLARNIGITRGGGLYVGDNSVVSIRESSFVSNAASGGGGISALLNTQIDAEHCIVAYSTMGHGVELVGSSAQFVCSDIYGNVGGDWTGSLLPQLWQDGNIQASPQFCDTNSGNYHLRSDSPCSEANSPCGRMGVLPVDCGTGGRGAPINWSIMKRLY